MSGEESDAVLVTRDDVSDFNPDSILPESPQTIRRIRSWLKPTSYNLPGGEYRKHLASHAPGTGSWLTASTKYQEWLHGSEHGLLWLTGIPGSGKSVMAAMLADELGRTSPASPVLFFFFRQIVESNHRPDALLRDWLDQVLGYSPPLQQLLKDEMQMGSEPSTEKMWEHLRFAFARLPERVFCVADGLDEMGTGHDTFLQELGKLGNWRPDKAKVLITSRPVPSVEIPLRHVSCLAIRLQENMVDVDISTYVRSALSTSTIPQDQWQVIADAVPGRANGLFLYAKLAMDAFLAPGADVTTVLAKLPADLGVLYTDLLRKHAVASGIDPVVQYLILQSVTHTSRPLRLLELAELIRVTFKVNGKPQRMSVAKDLIRAACGPLVEILPDETVSVVHHSFTEYIKGAIYSDASAGSRYPIFQEGQSHAQLALACLRYMQSGFLDRGFINPPESSQEPTYHELTPESDSDDQLPSPSTNERTRLQLKHPFLNYASNHWSWHITKSEAAGHDQTEINAAIREFFGHNDRLQAMGELHPRWRISLEGEDAMLHIAVRAGLVSFARDVLLRGQANVHASERYGFPVLSSAAASGNTELVRDLIAAGADPSFGGEFDPARGKPLMLAAKRRKAEVVKLLLELGVDPISGSREPQQQQHPREPPLMLACQQGHIETVSAFLPFLRETWMLQFGLYWAAGAGKPELVKIFLEQPGIDINAHVGKETALYAACGRCHPPTIEVLLKAGADPSVFCADSPYSNVLMEPESVGGAFEPERNSFHNLHREIVASWRYQEEWLSEETLQSILTLFIEAGIDINQPDTDGKTALHLAVENRGLEVARVLLDAGARVDTCDNEGQTPLHKAIGGDMISLLVEHGHARLDAMDNEGRSPLQLAFARSDLGAGVMTLLEYGGDFNAADASGNTILHVAVKSRSRERTIPQVLRDLLDQGVDPNRKNHDGLTPLLVASGQRYRSIQRTQVIDVLLEAGADINSTDNGGSTVLFRALQELVNAPPQHQPLPVLTPLILGLIERGASIHARDLRGRTLLHEAIKIMALPSDDIHERVNIPLLSFLSSLGLDLKAVDNDGNNLLHELASRNAANSLNHNPSYGGGVPVWKWLVQQGLELHSKNVAGRTPLHILCKTASNENLALVTKWVPFYFVVSETKDLNSPDMYGVYPLHVAATTNPRYTRALLEAGADPTVVTHEGLTPLHLAARSRQSNVVGMLLDALEKRSGVPGDDDSRRHGPRFRLPRDAATKPIPGVDAAAYGGNNHITPLFFACQSGRPETVALLLAAGASVRSAFQGCLGFAAEDRLWKNPDQLGRVGYEFRGDAAGVRIDDASRPRVGVGAGNAKYSETANSNTRMEEILEMLAQHGANLSPHQGPLEALAYRMYKGAAYKPSDPDDVRDRRADESRLTITKYLDHENVASKKAAISALKEFQKSRPDLLNEDLFHHLQAEKQYYLVEELSMLGESFLTAEIGAFCNFRSLVSRGFTQLVERIGAMEAENSMKNGGVWHAFGQPARPGLWCSQRKPSEAEPNAFFRPGFFLRDAVGRELPNLDVVKLLVEKFGVDIDEVQPTEIYADISNWDFPTDSALHLLAQGKNWWHVHQALPYLLQAGAKVDVRDGNGRTPLHLALVSDGVFSGDAATRLLDAGADMNAVDEMGKSCFDHAWRSGNKMKLLLDHGASVGADTVQAAIHAHDPVILEALLSSRPELASADTLTEEGSAPNKDQKPPLLQACWHVSGSPAKLAEDEAAIEVVKVLLRHGADPLAKFSQKLPRESRTNPVPRRGPHTVQERIDEANSAKYREATILHELLFQKDYADCLLVTPGLDLNHRDSEGCTLLQTIFQIPRSSERPPAESKSESPSEIATRVFLRLISLGADIEACDDQGRNVLHHMFYSGDEKGKDFSFYRDALPEVLRIAPNLINQPDDTGRTPLREAVVHAAKRRDPEIADLLFQHGGNPLDHDADGNSLLHVLARKLDDEATRSLFRRLVTGSPGVDVNTRNKREETPLFPFAARLVAEYSSEYRNSLVVEKAAITMLQELGADFHAKDNEGRGLLHVAAQGETLRFKQLLDLGLDALMEDNAHQTPIDVAAAKGNTKILELFEKEKK